MPPLILLFDGECMLCDGAVRWLLRRAPAGKLRVAALQSAPGGALLAEYGLPPGFTDSVVALAHGRAYLRADAVLITLQSLGWGWRLVAGLGRLLPRSLREVAYRWIARNRYQWFGRRPAQGCPLPTPAERAAILE